MSSVLRLFGYFFSCKKQKGIMFIVPLFIVEVNYSSSVACSKCHLEVMADRAPYCFSRDEMLLVSPGCSLFLAYTETCRISDSGWCFCAGSS